MTTESDQLFRGIQLLDQAVAGGHWGKAKFWGGAGVGIVTEMPTGNYNTAYKYVVTPYAAELGWLVADLWQVFREHSHIDHVTKFEFCGRVANAALHYQSRANGTEELRDLLGAIIHEAYAIAEEIEEGTFEALPVAPVGVVLDDLVERSDRDGYQTVEETRQWFDERGIKGGPLS